MKKPRILLAEDDPSLGRLLRDFLEVKGHEVFLARDGEEAIQAYKMGPWDCCILDVMMPKHDGFSIGKMIRKDAPQLPLMYLTARNMLDDKKEGFGLGADDYLTKPFNMDELLLRIGALLRRSVQETASKKEADPQQYRLGTYHFDYPSRELSIGGKVQRLTSREAELLRLLAIHQNEILKRDSALRQIWGDDSYFNARSMDVFITKLRKYLSQDPMIEIMNVHGLGYKMIVRG